MTLACSRVRRVASSVELRCGPEHLCKTLLLENKSCSGEGGATALDSRYVCVVVQYVSKFSSDDLATGLASKAQAEGLNATKGSYTFQMADEETAHRLSGFEYNALTPFGMKADVPVRPRVLVGWPGGARRCTPLRLAARCTALYLPPFVLATVRPCHRSTSHRRAGLLCYTWPRLSVYTRVWYAACHLEASRGHGPAVRVAWRRRGAA